MAEQPHVIVYPPDAEGTRRVRVDGAILGRAYGMADVIEFLRRAGLEDEADWPPMEWRGGGPEVWAAGPADGPGAGS